MKRIIIDGEVGEELKKQMNHLDALSKGMEDLALMKHELGTRMWKQIRKEYPDISENCSLSIIDGTALLVDRLND
jgi:hypothetical protein